MIKNTALLLAITLAGPIYCNENIQPAANISTIKDHIATQKAIIRHYAKEAILLAHKNQLMFQNIMGNDYEGAKEHCFNILADLTASEEFITTIEQVATLQANAIVNGTNFHDIVINSADYPLETKIKELVKKAGINEQIEQLFNTFYVSVAISRGCYAILKKLDDIDLNNQAAQKHPQQDQ